MNSNQSPQSYFKNNLYISVPKNVHKKKIKVKTEDFSIPDYFEYEKMIIFNFNVKQLKEICKYYKQKRSGNKTELILRLYNYLKFSFHSIFIQKLFRGYLQRKYNSLRGPALFKRSKCVNETDFMSLGKLTEVPYIQFFSIIDKDKFVYGFDICSLYNLVSRSKDVPTNPYNRSIFLPNVIGNMREIIRLSKIFNDSINVQLEDCLIGLSAEKRIQLRAISVFQRIDELGNHSNSSWFLNLSRDRLIKYIRELVDIWCYRANLSPQVKRSICPPLGNPFAGLNINSINFTTNKLKNKILFVMENLVSKGVDRDARALGALYILTALTLVSKEAAEMRPELYESAVHN